MTDFVSRLLGVPGAGGPPIRPLTGSLFEPRRARRPVQDALPMPGESTGRTAAPLPGPAGVRAAVPAVPAGPGRRAGAAARGQETGPPTHLRAPVGPRPQEWPADPTDHRPEAPGEAPSSGGTAPPPATRPSEGPVAPDPARLPGDHPPAGALRPGTGPLAGSATGPAAGSMTDPATDAATGSATDRASGSVTDPVREHPVRPLHTAARPAGPAPAAPWPQSRQGPAAEPTVHITIGRVEVRATRETPAPARRRPERQPATSLDDYLRTRSGGDRR